LIELELIGEITKATAEHPARFRRGVTAYPRLGDPARSANREELSALFGINGAASARIGSIRQDNSIPATVAIDKLFSRHCAILGTTGAGKSCALAVMLRSILARFNQGHVVLLDAHNEYARCFDNQAKVFNVENLSLPYWMMSFDELVEVLFPGRNGVDQEIAILAELIPQARRVSLMSTGGGARLLSERRSGDTSALTVNTPAPYRVSELLQLIDKALSAVEGGAGAAPYRRLRSRLSALSNDARYAFMFSRLSVQDTMPELLADLFRIPVAGSPISIIELGSLPTEVAPVVVSVIARLAFEFGMWSSAAVPIAVVCEDAHRFAPSCQKSGFEPARRALIQLAKEGRRAGVGLWVSSQRPTELDPAILTQCNTIFAMRLANQTDQDALQAAAPDASTSLLSVLPSLGPGEAVAVGDGVALPVRMRFDALPRNAVPRCETPSFANGWSADVADETIVARAVEQWRAQRFITPEG
ncbi:MAG: DUF87 domain-containing protein, partial [Pseudomonadota bacterium]